MKLNLLTSAFAAVLVLACAPVQADDMAAPVTTSASTSTTTTTSTTVSMKKVPYKGTITAVDTTANTVTIQGLNGTMTLAITPMTKYKGGAALTDFAVGDKVTGSYTKDASGAMTAHSLHKKASTK
jgi:hypothetical protein